MIVTDNKKIAKGLGIKLYGKSANLDQVEIAIASRAFARILL